MYPPPKFPRFRGVTIEFLHLHTSYSEAILFFKWQKRILRMLNVAKQRVCNCQSSSSTFALRYDLTINYYSFMRPKCQQIAVFLTHAFQGHINVQNEWCSARGNSSVRCTQNAAGELYSQVHEHRLEETNHRSAATAQRVTLVCASNASKTCLQISTLNSKCSQRVLSVPAFLF